MVYLPIAEGYIAVVALIRQSRDVPAIIKHNNYSMRRELKAIFANNYKEKIKRLSNPHRQIHRLTILSQRANRNIIHTCFCNGFQCFFGDAT